MPNTFASEESVVQNLCRLLADGDMWTCSGVTTEFEFARGRSDVVAETKDGFLIAFEVKLARWKDALSQAYKNTSFVHHSYVVVPKPVAQKAMRYKHEFVRRSVGLCQVEANGITVLIPACHQNPLLPWLSAKAISKVKESGDCSQADA